MKPTDAEVMDVLAEWMAADMSKWPCDYTCPYGKLTSECAHDYCPELKREYMASAREEAVRRRDARPTTSDDKP